MNTCENCAFTTYFNQFGFSQCSKTYNTIVVPDMSCPRFKSKESEIPMFLKDWKPVWRGLSEPEPPTRQLVLMWYMGEPKPKVGFAIGGIWYKAAGSTTPPPDFWCELP
jgi:hypothetical protein